MACPIENRAACMFTQRKIQNDDVTQEGASLGLAHVPPREHRTERTSYFDMVEVRACDRACENMCYTCQSASLHTFLAM
eukprot:6491314-Amphidinium_carterae.4